MITGRPTVMTKETMDKIEIAFSNGATDREACFIAGISQQTLYDYQTRFPEFIERKESLKDMPKYQARHNIVKAIYDGDKQQSNWYLERKVKNEFAQRSEVTGTEGRDLIPDSDTKDKMDTALASFLNGDTKDTTRE